MIFFNNYGDTDFNYIFRSSLLPFWDQEIMANLNKYIYIYTQSELFSYCYSVVIELFVPQSETASK